MTRTVSVEALPLPSSAAKLAIVVCVTVRVYQVKYYGEELSSAELILKELLENSDVSFGEHKVMSALNDLATLYETLAGIQEPKALLTCTDCVVDLD